MRSQGSTRSVALCVVLMALEHPDARPNLACNDTHRSNLIFRSNFSDEEAFCNLACPHGEGFLLFFQSHRTARDRVGSS